MVERRQLSYNSCQVSLFMEENLLHSETMSRDFPATTDNVKTSIYAGDQNYSHTQYGNFGSVRFVFL